MKKTHLILATTLLLTIATHAQDTIGLAISTTDTVPHASSILDITSTSKGLLIPRMTTTQKAAISSPADGLMVYDSDKKGLYIYDGGTSKWKMMGDSVWTKNSGDIYYNVGNVGIGTTTPGSNMHVFAGSSGGSTHQLARLTVEDDNFAMVSILTSNDRKGYFAFADADDDYVGGMTYDHQNDQLELYTNNRAPADFVLNSNGYIGIGTTSPTVSLQIENQQNYAEMHLASYDNTTAGGFIRLRRARGTQASPAIVQNDDFIGGVLFQGHNGSAFNNMARIYSYADGTVTSTSTPGRISFQTTPVGQVANYERMVIKSDGKIGIGTSAPSELIELSSNTNSEKVKMEISGKNSSGTVKEGWLTFDPGQDMLYLENGNTGKLGIKDDGSVGVGTTSPNTWSIGSGFQFLTVQASGTNNQSVINISGTGTGGSGINLGNSSIRRASVAAADGSHLTLWTNASNSGTGLTERMRITSSGNVGIATTTPSEELDVAGDLAVSDTIFYGTLFQSSDQRLKQNISNYSAGLEKLRRINPVKYEYNGQARTPGGQRVGIIAQDLQTVVPEAVKKVSREYKEGDVADYTGPKAFVRTQTETTENGDTTQVNIYKAEHLGYDQNVLFYLMLNAIKELDAANTQKDAVINDLKTRIETLENQ